MANSSMLNPNGTTIAANIQIDSDEKVIIKNLHLRDKKTGRLWSIEVEAGELIISPTELQDKRDYKLNKIFKINE